MLNNLIFVVQRGKNKGKEVLYQDAIKHRKLYNKVKKLLNQLEEVHSDLDFQSETVDTRNEFFNGCSNILSFLQNLKVQDKFNK